MRWIDIAEICEALREINPRIDTRILSEREIADLVTRLPDFADDPAGWNAGHIEAIRASAWWGP